MLKAIVYLHGSGAPEVVRALQAHLPASEDLVTFLVGKCEFIRQNGLYWHHVELRAPLALSIAMIQARSPDLTGSLIAWKDEPDAPTGWIDGKLPITIIHAHKASTRREIIAKALEVAKVVRIDLPTLYDALTRS